MKSLMMREKIFRNSAGLRFAGRWAFVEVSQEEGSSDSGGGHCGDEGLARHFEVSARVPGAVLVAGGVVAGENLEFDLPAVRQDQDDFGPFGTSVLWRGPGTPDGGENRVDLLRS